MANRGIEGFDEEAFYDEQYAVPTTDRHLEGQHPQMIPYTTAGPMQVGNYAYPSHRSDLLEGGVSAALVPSVSLGGRMPSTMLAYEPLPTTGGAISMGLDAGNNFAYDPSIYPPTTLAVDQSLEHRQASQFRSVHPQPANPDGNPTYPSSQAQDSTTGVFWPQSQATGEVHPSVQGIAARPSGFSQPADHLRNQTLPHRQPRDGQPMSHSSSSSSGPSHRFIQPKRPVPSKASSSSTNPEAGGETSNYTSIYSKSGFDMMSILAEVVARPDPKINIGAVDLSCAFVLCDITLNDHPIVYVSQAFERLTGYNESEIVGRNCRFLQGPDGSVEQGVPRKFVDTNTAFRLRSTIEERAEIQASIINYRKGGQPFMNLITMIPVRGESNEYRFFVGFQVDLVEKPEAIMKRNPNGSYMINYQRSQLPSYVVPSPDAHREQPDPATRFGPEHVSLILEGLDTADPAIRSQLDDILVENTDDVIHVVSFDFEFLYLSPSCRKVLEYKSTDLVGKTLSTVCHPSDIGPVIRDLRACTTNDPVSVLYRIRRKTSGYTWFESHGAWHISERGRQFMVLVGRLIPVYHLDQIARMKQGSLAENDLWAKVSLSGLVLFISSKSRPVLGRTADDLIGKSILDLVGTDSRQEVQQALESARSGRHTTFSHRIRHRKGHMLPANTTFYPGDTKEGLQPTFLVAQLRFPKPSPATTSGDDPSSSDSLSAETSAGKILEAPRINQPLELIIGSSQSPRVDDYESLFTELGATRGSSWQFELRELERKNRTLSDEVQRLLARRKKRKRKQNTVLVEKTCAMCQTKTTPEWRRGPSGNRDLCNSCGLRWAKQVRNAAQEKAAEA